MIETGYFAPEGFEQDLLQELGSSVTEQFGRLVLAEGPPRPIAWCENVWRNPRRLPVESIGDAARALRELAPRWAHYSYKLHRRAELIHEKIPRAKGIALDFLGKIPTDAPGSFLMLEPNLILASPDCSSVLANGEVTFKENKSAPSRAYLKLWELFTVHGIMPEESSRCLDLGSSPGSWTWVLQSVGADVISVDKAPLDPKIAKLKRVEVLKRDAFRLDPLSIEPVDWLFSDIICEPARLFDLVNKWRESKRAQGFVCTLKFKGKTDMESARRFAEIPGSTLTHLHHNKHELTWFLAPK